MERLAKFVPAVNVPQIVALNAVPGRLVPSGFGPSEVVFDLTDGRPWYVPQVIADEIYRAGIVARQQVEVTATGRKKTELRIVPVQASLGTAPVSRRTETSQAGLPRTEPGCPSSSATAVAHPAAAPRAKGSMANLLAGALIASIDAYAMARDYALGKGLQLDVDFTSGDIRASANTMLIEYWRTGGEK